MQPQKTSINPLTKQAPIQLKNIIICSSNLNTEGSRPSGINLFFNSLNSAFKTVGSSTSLKFEPQKAQFNQQTFKQKEKAVSQSEEKDDEQDSGILDHSKYKFRLKKKDQKVGKQLKNYLNCMKHCIIRLLEKWFQKSDESIEKKKIIKDLMNNVQTNLPGFTSFLCSDEVRKILCSKFRNGKLERELQLSRVSNEQRGIFRLKVVILRRALINSHLTNL